MNIVSYGGGVNSTAMLIECVNRRLPVDLILFSDTGGERPNTYRFVEEFSDWCADHGLPRIITVKAPNKTLEQDCLDRKTLPSIAFGFKTCSQRWKAQPQNKYINNWKPAKEEWANGNKITKLIGFDADEPQRAKDFDDDKYTVKYPLIEWDMGRDECLELIKVEGLEVGKSSCFFCPSMRPTEIKELKKNHPCLADRCIQMEKNAELTHIKGLGRNWSWTDLLNQGDMFDDPVGGMIDAPCGCYDG